MMRDILTGGACNVTGDSSQQANVNPFNRFMGTIFTGQAQNADRMQGFQGVGVPQGDLMKNALNERGQMMGMMNKEFDALNKDMNNLNINNTMEQNFRQQQHHMNQQHAHLDHVFMHQQTMMAQEARMREQMMHHQFQQQQHMQAQRMLEMEKNMSAQFDGTKAQLEAEDMARELMMENALDAAEKEGTEDDIKQQIIQQNANELYDKMAGDSSPRIKNSKFLQFMGQIKTGELKIDGDQLVQGDPSQVQDLNKIFDNAWAKSEEEQKESEKMMGDNYNLEAYWQEKIQEYEKERLNEDEFSQKLEKDYADVLKYMEETGDYSKMDTAWQKASDVEEQNLYKDASDHYQFQQNNPYLAHENPLHLALEFITQGKIFDAILALEAQLQKNPNAPSNANSWRILGRLHQENDQDQRAVACFLNALKKDNKNPDTFLALGVSCTNILDEVKAMNFLKHWYMISELQKQMPINPQLVPEDKEYSEFSLEEIKAINRNMLDAFIQARNINPQSPELNVGLAVLQYISRDYAGSVNSFREALKYDPNNYSLWNKLGATLAQLGRSDEAIEAYYKALELKPNYVRVWVNLGIAHAYKQDYSEAARLYLNALSFNPEAKHLWSYLQTCFMCLQRFDLVGKIGQHNPALFSDEFEILRLDQLPQPEVNYNEATKKYLISESEINEWLSEFKSQPPM